MAGRYPIFIITALTALISLNLCFMALAWGWFGLYANAGSGFCEAMRDGWIKQPANTWSNLGFVAAGLSMAWSLARGTFQENRNALTQSSVIATCFCCLAVLMGPGSMAMHASGTRLGGFIDVLAMYLIASFLVAYSARRAFGFTTMTFLLLFGVALTICIWADRQHGFRIFVLGPGNIAFAVCLTLTAFLEVFNVFVKRQFTNIAWGLASLGAILVAFFIWNMSRTGCAWCSPNSLIQGHAAWHLLDALSLYCLFRYYVSQNEPETSAE